LEGIGSYYFLLKVEILYLKYKISLAIDCP